MSSTLCCPVLCRWLTTAVTLFFLPAIRLVGDESRGVDQVSLPDPPAQKQAFKPPAETKLVANFVTATSALFDLGLADPRGCEYRTVKLTVGDISFDGGQIETHAWVLPAIANRPDPSARFAVAWNGLVYRIAEVGEKADLQADVISVCKADEDSRASGKHDVFISSFLTGRAIDEHSSVSKETLLPIKACLLLRLGETSLAERVWQDGLASIRNERSKQDDPFVALAGDWLWAMFDRAVTAHMRGDDRLALADLRRLKAVQKQAGTIAIKRGARPNRGDAEETTHFDFLRPLLQLLTDHERRNVEQPRAPSKTKEIKDPNQRIAALIADLEEVSARQMSQPGGVALGQDPIVRALMKEGDAAVDPLINCLESDERLTRSVHYWRDFARSRSPIAVHEAAYVAISGILGESFFDPVSTGDDLSSRGDEQRKRLAAIIREYRKKYAGMTREDKWFSILADDNGGERRWIEAANNIVRPVEEEPAPSSMFGGGGLVAVANYKPGEPRRMGGEALRKKSNPSVGDLLAKRLRAVANQDDDRYRRRLRRAVAFAEALAVWDGKAHLKDLRDFSDSLRTAFVGGDEGTPYLIRPMVSITLERAALGDEKAIDEYARWVQEVTPKQAAFEAEKLFEPMWQFSGRPSVAAAAERIFGDPTSPWSPAYANGAGSFHTVRIYQTPVVGLAPVRRLFLVQLQNKSKYGTVECTEEGGVRVHRDAGWVESRGGSDANDPLRPAAGTQHDFRACDFIAEQLSAIEGFPRIELYWPEKNRDEAIKNSTAILTQYGERLAWSPEFSPRTYFLRPAMTFPKLERPASPDDVAKGQAIFALEGERRIWKMPARTLKRRWESLRTRAAVSRQLDAATGKAEVVTTWLTEGTIWQAEEVRVGDKWVRWFGLVAPSYLGKAPADEVELELPDHWSWTKLSKGIEWRLQVPDADNKSGSLPPGFLTTNKPLNIELHIRNILGIDQLAPDDWYRPDNKSFATGLEIRLQRLDQQAAPRHPEITEKWGDAPQKKIPRFAPDRRSKLLAVGEELKPIVFDLRTVFDVTKEGTYRINLVAPKGPSDDSPPTTRAITFTIPRADAGEP